MSVFKLKGSFTPAGDQPEAVKKLVEGLGKGYDKQTLLGVSDHIAKTFCYKLKTSSS